MTIAAPEVDPEVRGLNNRLVKLLARLDDTPLNECPTAELDEVRAIGREFHRRGGLPAMQHAYRSVKKMGLGRAVPLPALLALNVYWDEVAEWRV